MAKVTLNERSIRRAPPAVGQIELRDLYTPGFGLRIAAGGARTYFAMRRVNGKMVRRTVGRAHIGEGPPAPGELLLADARSKARLILSDLQRGIDSQGDLAARAVRKTENARYAKAAAIAEDLCAASAASRTFAAVSANYFADPSKRGGASLRSRAELERKVRVDLAAWHDLSIDAITRQEIRAVVKRKARTSPVSANRLLALIRRILRWAVREEIIAGNPATDIDPPAQETERARVLTLEELARIWAGCDVLGYPFGPIIKILILTAQRRSEVGSLRWSEINESVWRLPDLRAKRGKGHLIPLSPRAVAILAAVVKVGDNPELVFTTGRRRFPPAPGEKVVPAPVGGWSRAKKRLDRIITQTAADAAGELIDPARHAIPPWTIHDIRRSVATHLRDGDVMGDDRVERLIVSKLLNHAEGGETRKYDRYSSDPEQRQALEAWARRIEALVGLNVVQIDSARA